MKLPPPTEKIYWDEFVEWDIKINKMKAYTDINQSKKLAEILPIGGDMCYLSKDGRGTEFFEEPVVNDGTREDDDIPCWSLAALLDIINENYYTTLYHDGVAWNLDIIHHDNDKEKHSVYANTPIDACYEMIVKLHEQKLL